MSGTVSRVVLESGLESGVKLVLVYTAGSECFEPQKLNPIFGNAIKPGGEESNATDARSALVYIGNSVSYQVSYTPIGMVPQP